MSNIIAALARAFVDVLDDALVPNRDRVATIVVRNLSPVDFDVA